jgi:hypothetical protein
MPTITTDVNLLEPGFLPGAPPQVTQRSQDIDRRSCRRMLCGQCRSRGLECHVYHKGERYKVVAVCPRCLHAEEV